ncbi:hypothetical protein HZS_1140 [Henneguya salminicola]|nr:hypothetical protein HZS_1140 [Henneguya salminicola]
MPYIWIVFAIDIYFVEHKGEECYSAAFNLLSDNSNLSPKSVVVDFEMGLINSRCYLGTDVDVYGCVFHYA